MDSRGEPTPETDLGRRLLDDVPGSDDAAKARARSRLLEAIDRERQNELATPPSAGPHRIRWFVMAAAIAAASTLLVILPVGHGGPTRTAATELERLSEVASNRPAPQGDGSGTFSTAQEELRPETQTVIGQGTFTVISRLSTQTSLASDGSGQTRTTVQDAYLASDRDEAEWIAAGSPPIPRAGDVRIDDYGPGGLPFYDLDDLPTQVPDLRRALKEGQLEGFALESVDDLSVLGALLAQPNATPSLRSALFELASDIEGVQLIPDAIDPLGRSGIGISSATASHETELIVDPATSAILSITDTPTDPNDDGHVSWVAYAN